MAFRSCSGVEMGIILNFSTSTLRMLGVITAGKLGPNRMFLIPRYNSVNSIETAFCSNQDIMRDRGSSFTPT